MAGLQFITRSLVSMKNRRTGFATKKDIQRMAQLEANLVKNSDDFASWLEKGILLYDPFYETKEAIETLEALIKKDPHNVDALFWLAECQVTHGANEKEAERILRIALAIDPNRADCHNLLGSIIFEDGQDKEEAMFHCKKAIELEPTWIAPRKILARILLKKGNPLEAKIVALAALKLVKNTIPPLNDPIKEHYETFITGRYDIHMKETLTNLLEKIDAALRGGQLN